MYVLNRFNVSEEEVIENFTKTLHNYAMLSRHDRISNKVEAKELATLADWKELIANYFEAHNQALKKINR